ncbi:SdpI family protein [[Clostridium] dakarense]|uniref:SdpI family protein n=1 Tax=Faecalimicrobium dakarense TaxID=1301100 RepID=UPI0004B001C6|nr:SdpI family protein [[Clostridium] dakarense]
MYKKLGKLYWFLSTLPTIITLIILPYLPNQIPVHYSLGGEVNRYGSKYESLVLPLICIIIAFLIPYLSNRYDKYDIKSKSNIRVNNLMFIVMNILNLFFLYNAYTMSDNLNGNLSSNIFNGILPITFIIMGNYMPKTTPNPVFGIRIKATLSDEDVWYKTHRMAGKLWVITGVVTLIIVAWSSFDFGVTVSMIVFVIDVFIPIVYANKIYKLKNNA